MVNDNWCLLCGGTLVPHDDAACDAKMAAWSPIGIQNMKTSPTFIISDEHLEDVARWRATLDRIAEGGGVDT